LYFYFSKNKYIQSVIALGIYLNFTVSKVEFLKLQLYTIPFILSNSKEFMIEQKKIIDINSKCSIPFEISNENKNIILYFTPVKLNQILSSSSTPDVGTTIESMTNHVKSLILSNFISKLYSSNDDIVNYLKFNSLNLSKDTIYNSIFMTRYTEDVNSIGKYYIFRNYIYIYLLIFIFFILLYLFYYFFLYKKFKIK